MRQKDTGPQMVHYQVRLCYRQLGLNPTAEFPENCVEHIWVCSTWEMKLEYLCWTLSRPSLAEDCSQGQCLPSSSGLLSGKASLRCSWNGPGAMVTEEMYTEEVLVVLTLCYLQSKSQHPRTQLWFSLFTFSVHSLLPGRPSSLRRAWPAPDMRK